LDATPVVAPRAGLGSPWHFVFAVFMLTALKHPAMLVLLAAGLVSSQATAQVSLPNAKPIPLVQALPQPYEQVSFQRDGVELARLHFGPGLNRPFVFPLLGPSGRSVTRMGHPHDPTTRSGFPTTT
jgi:hypothetical protein